MESPTFVILTVLSIYPLVYTLCYSLTNFYYISKDRMSFIGLKNYADLARNPYFIRAVINTIKFTVACTLLETAAGIGVAVYVNGLRHFKKTMRTIRVNIFLSQALNAVAVVLAMTGIMGPVAGALVHNVGSVAVIISSAMLLNFNEKKNGKDRQKTSGSLKLSQS